MALTTADLDLLLEMVAGNILESETADGKRIKFGSMKELERRVSWVQRYLRGTRGPRTAHVRFDPEEISELEGL